MVPLCYCVVVVVVVVVPSRRYDVGLHAADIRRRRPPSAGGVPSNGYVGQDSGRVVVWRLVLRDPTYSKRAGPNINPR